MTPKTARNVLGSALVPCSYDPLTGWRRDGCCSSEAADAGSHLVCARMTVAFLNFQMERGNDLIRPRPRARFPGLKPGDRWCVCALRWREAYEAGCAPPVVLESTHERALEFVLLEWLQARAWRPAEAGDERDRGVPGDPPAMPRSKRPRPPPASEPGPS